MDITLITDPYCQDHGFFSFNTVMKAGPSKILNTAKTMLLKKIVQNTVNSKKGKSLSIR